jgi:two-component sensor histidine kinase
MPISSSTVLQSSFAFLFAGFAILLGIVGMTFWLQERSQSYFDQAIAARDTRSAAVELRNAVQTAESSQRGFVLTGNEIYLAPFDTAKAQAQRQLASLKGLMSSYPNSDVAMQRLATLVASKFDEMDQTVVLKRSLHDAEAMAIVRTNKGKALMDEANVFFSGVIAQADQRLTDGVNEQRSNAGWLRLLTAIGAVAIIAVVGGATFVLFRYTRELRIRRDEVTALNADLEQRVSERTADLVQARDRAQVLLSEVNHRVANSLSLVSSLISLQSKAIGDQAAKRALAEMQDRILAISLVHRRLYESTDVRMVTLDEYLSSLLEHLRTSLHSDAQGIRLTYALDPIQLETDASINLGVILTEWVTNGFKYAYPDGAGEIRVRLKELAAEQAQLVVEDDGVGRIEGAAPKGSGVGTRIVSAMAASLGSDIRYDSREPGLAAFLTFSTRPRRLEQ